MSFDRLVNLFFYLELLFRIGFKIEENVINNFGDADDTTMSGISEVVCNKKASISVQRR